MEFKTYEQIAVDKLKEIEPATRKQWGIAIGHTTRNSMQRIANKCVKLNLVIANKTKKPYIYTINKEEIKNGKEKF